MLRTASTRKPSTLIAIDRCIRLTEMTRLLSPLTASSTPLTPSSAPPRMQTLSPLLFELADRLFSKQGRVRTAYHDSSSNEPGLPASKPTFVVCATLTNRAPRFSLTGDLYISSLFEGPARSAAFVQLEQAVNRLRYRKRSLVQNCTEYSNVRRSQRVGDADRCFTPSRVSL